MFASRLTLPPTVRNLFGAEKIEHTVQVTSFGGVGTTMLYQFLDKHGLNTPDGHDWLPYKHMAPPPPDRDVRESFRAIYMFDNPMNAILSVFRRGFQHWHAQNMLGDACTWDDDWTLEDFLERGKDHFRMHEHFRLWATARRNYPIMLLKFDALWRRLPEVFAFLGLPSCLLDEFPVRRKRHSDWTDQPAANRESLLRLYGELHDEITAFPELKIIVCPS